MKTFWKSLGMQIVPKDSFRESLRARLYEDSSESDVSWFQKIRKGIRIPASNLAFRRNDYKRFSFSESVSAVFGSLRFPEWAFRWVFGGSALAMLAISPFLSYFWGQESSAMEVSVVRNVQGSVLGEMVNGTLFPIENFFEVVPGETISTGENSSLEILFFEGSVLRLDENTTIKIETILPHQIFSSSGQVEIFIETGRIWEKTYQKTENGFGVVVKSPEAILSPNAASFDFSRKDGKDTLRVFSHSVDIVSSGVDYEQKASLFFLESLSFSPFEKPSFSQVTSEEKSEDWVQKNLLLDESYHKEFLEKIKEKQKNDLLGEGDGILSFSKKTITNEEMDSLFSRLNDAVLLVEAGEDEAAKKSFAEVDTAISSLNATTNGDALKKIQEGLAISSSRIGSAGKNTSALVVKEAIEKKQEEISQQEIVVSPEGSPVQISPSINMDLTSEEKEVKRIDSVEESFADQVNVYKAPEGRINQATLLLKRISAKPENLRLLRTLIDSAPSDVKELVRARYKVVLEETRKQKLQEQEQKNSKKRGS